MKATNTHLPPSASPRDDGLAEANRTFSFSGHKDAHHGHSEITPDLLLKYTNHTMNKSLILL